MALDELPVNGIRHRAEVYAKRSWPNVLRDDLDSIGG